MARSDDTIYMLLLRVSRIVQRAAVDLLFEIGVSPLEAWLLDAIPDDGRACASDLAEKLEVPTSTVTRALRRMEGYGYLTLTKGFFFDARVLRAEITPLGSQVRSVASGFEHSIDAMMLKGFPPNAFGLCCRASATLKRRGGRRSIRPPRRRRSAHIRISIRPPRRPRSAPIRLSNCRPRRGGGPRVNISIS